MEKVGSVMTLEEMKEKMDRHNKMVSDATVHLGTIQCLSPAKKYKIYKNSINKSIHFVQRSLSSSPRGQRVTAQLNLSR